MDQDRWKKVKHIFHAALDIPEPEREQFVARVAEGDTGIAEEVKLLLKADEAAGSYIETPAVNPDAFRRMLYHSELSLQAGDVLCGRFRIVCAVGEGGMGEVFEAVDSELGVQVALKTIRAEIADNPQALARFRQEVRLARKITHPNVCRAFDLERETRVVSPSTGETREIVFLTMEFLDGETLACRIRREGALALPEALEVARQVAAGLEAARALGVVHRDIKPGNVMLARRGKGVRAVITDFGLARLDAAEMARSSSGLQNRTNPIGTLAYMAPEQLEDGAITPATDVYAFGLLLYEMVTGQRAFPSDTLLSGIAQRLTGNIPQAKAVVPELPESWAAAIEGCLKVKPEERFASAADAVAVVEGRGAGARRGERQGRRLRAWASPRRLMAAVLVTAVALSLFWAGLRYSGWKGDSHVTAGALVYLAPVKNETGEKALDNLTELLRAGLSQSAHINLLDQGRVGDTLQHMEKTPGTVIDEPVAREIAMRNGAVRVVFARVRGGRGSYRLDVDVQQPDNTPERARNEWARSFAWQGSAGPENGTIPQPLLSAVRDASDWTRKEVGESVDDIARLNAPPDLVTTGKWEALTDYSLAQTLFASHKREEAIGMLRNAVKVDPSFAVAQASLGDILVNFGREEDGYEAYRRALESAENGRLSLRERDRIKGLVAQDTGDYEASEQAYRDLTLFYEFDYLAWFRRGLPLLALGRTEDALVVLSKAHQLDTSRAAPVVQLVFGNMVLGNQTAVNDWLSVLREKYDKDFFLYAQGPVQFVRGDYAGAENSFREVARSSNPAFQWAGSSMLADVEAERGEYEAALATLTDILSRDPENPMLLLDRAHVHCKLQNFDECLADLNHALERDPGPLRLISASAVLGIAIHNLHGVRAEPLRRFLELVEKRHSGRDQGVILEIARHRIRGEVLLAQGDPRAAVAEFRKVDKLEAPLQSREYLARALMALAGSEKDAAAAQKDMNEAASLFAAIAAHPAACWYYPLSYPPGFYADQVEAFLKASARDATAGKVPGQMAATLIHLRPKQSAKFRSSPGV